MPQELRPAAFRPIDHVLVKFNHDKPILQRDLNYHPLRRSNRQDRPFVPLERAEIDRNFSFASHIATITISLRERCSHGNGPKGLFDGPERTRT